MQDREPSIRGREVGAALRRAMRANGFSGKHMAAELGWAQSQVSRLLSGKRGVREEDLTAFLNVCGVSGVERERLLHLVNETEVPVAAPLRPLLPAVLRTYLDYERRATHIFQFACLTVPDLLQTGDYAHAVLSASATVPREYVQFRLSATLGRAGLFCKESPPAAEFLLHEGVLRIPIGGPVVLAEQLRQVLRLSARNNVGLRVVPAAAGAHAGLAGGFSLLQFENFSPVVYRPSEPAGRLSDSPQDISIHQDIWAALQAAALPAEESRNVILTAAREVVRSTATQTGPPTGDPKRRG